MASINYANREIVIKIVYYGPGLSGKTTNLQVIHQNVPDNTRGNMISLATEADRTLFFDLLPLNLGSVKGFNTKFQLYTVPGQVYYNATRKLVLKGVDGVVFVADSGVGKMNENIESLQNLRDNLAEYGIDLNNFPIVLQYNKRDLQNVYSVEELNKNLNPNNVPAVEASVIKNIGVFEVLKAISRETLARINKPAGPAPQPGAQPSSAPAPTPQAAPAPAPVPQPAPAPIPQAAPPAPMAAPAPVPQPAPAPMPQAAPPAPMPAPAPVPQPAPAPVPQAAPPAPMPAPAPAPAPQPNPAPAPQQGGTFFKNLINRMDNR
ncbi:MAG: GTPase domain-containing protein [Bacteroidetes bacterium]|nr:GTPase domain-containing protein [Bacteroidota bacterium]